MFCEIPDLCREPEEGDDEREAKDGKALVLMNGINREVLFDHQYHKNRDDSVDGPGSAHDCTEDAEQKVEGRHCGDQCQLGSEMDGIENRETGQKAKVESLLVFDKLQLVQSCWRYNAGCEDGIGGVAVGDV